MVYVPRRNGRPAFLAAVSARLSAPSGGFLQIEDYGTKVQQALSEPLTVCPVCRGSLKYGKFSRPAGACFVTNATQGEMVCRGRGRKDA
jgi:hypothetical protein